MEGEAMTKQEFVEQIVVTVREMANDPNCRVTYERNIIEGPPDGSWQTFLAGNRFVLSIHTDDKKFEITAMLNRAPNYEVIKQ